MSIMLFTTYHGKNTTDRDLIEKSWIPAINCIYKRVAEKNATAAAEVQTIGTKVSDILNKDDITPEDSEVVYELFKNASGIEYRLEKNKY